MLDVHDIFLNITNFLKVKDVKYKSFNEMFDGTAASSWKTLDLVANQTKSPDHSFIEKPIKFTMRNGILSEIIVSENEPGKCWDFSSIETFLEYGVGPSETDSSYNLLEAEVLNHS